MGFEKPDYTHFSRLNTITGEEAQLLLASFDLLCFNFTDPSVYERMLKKKMELALRVLEDAMTGKFLNCKYDGQPSYIDESGEEFYHFSNIRFNTVEFLSWASQINYNLPDVLSELAKKHERKQTVEIKKITESGNNISTKQDNLNKSGKPQGTLAEAVKHSYEKLLSQGNSEVLKAGSLRGFLQCLKDMATEENKNADEYILERIESVKIPRGEVAGVSETA